MFLDSRTPLPLSDVGKPITKQPHQSKMAAPCIKQIPVTAPEIKIVHRCVTLIFHTTMLVIQHKHSLLYLYLVNSTSQIYTFCKLEMNVQSRVQHKLSNHIIL